MRRCSTPCLVTACRCLTKRFPPSMHQGSARNPRPRQSAALSTPGTPGSAGGRTPPGAPRQSRLARLEAATHAARHSDASGAVSPTAQSQVRGRAGEEGGLGGTGGRGLPRDPGSIFKGTAEVMRTRSARRYRVVKVSSACSSHAGR